MHMKPKKISIKTPLSDETIRSLKSGDSALISGVVYTARDSAHKRMIEALNRGESLSIDLEGQVIYYAGPSPAKPGQVIGSVGPTTACRMDGFTPQLLGAGLKGMIGKGARSDKVKSAIRKYGAVYFAAVGGAAALIAKCVKSAEIIAYDDLGPEAIRRLVVEDFPVMVVNDCHGGDLYESGRRAFQE